MPELSPPEALSKLLTRVFNTSELREFIRVRPDASDLYPRLPEGLSLRDLAWTVVDLLARRGAIDTSLFLRLLEARPRRKDEIMAVAARFPGVELPGDVAPGPKMEVPGPGPPRARPPLRLLTWIGAALVQRTRSPWTRKSCPSG